MVKSILVVVLFLFSQAAIAFSYTVEITEPELQEKILKIMPLVKNKFFVTVTLSEPKVDLQSENNNIAIFCRVEVTAPGGIKGTGKVKVSGSLKYEQKKYEFFLKDPVLESLEIDKVPDKFIPKIKNMSQQIITKVLAKRPVYKLKDNNLKHKLAKSLLQSITVKDEILYVVLGF
ncbi:MAG: DUF1439 domain-containing protein [Chlorobi bacterium]|nr:DUF1439 domain-containing protein [Chlorobiota bacterium]